MRTLTVAGRMFTDEYRATVVTAYREGASLGQCAGKFGVDKSTVADWCRIMGVPIRDSQTARRVYRCDDAAFNSSSPEKAYWLGFLIADGCISVREGRTPALSIALQERDKSHLEQLRSFLKSNARIHYETNSKSVRLWIASAALCDALMKRGCLPHKSLTVEYPVSGLFYRRHFVRGYFDGDGSISCNEKVYCQPTVAFVGTAQFLFGLQDVLCEDIDLSRNKLYAHSKSSVKYLAWTGRNNIRKIYDYLYSEPGPLLLRKKMRFEHALAYGQGH